MTVLECLNTDPFTAWSDWAAPEANVGLVFETMAFQLQETWNEHCKYGVDQAGDSGIRTPYSDGVVDHSQFRPEELRPPGIHREVDSDGYEHYHVVVPSDHLHPEICDAWIRRINSEYDRDFELVVDQ